MKVFSQIDNKTSRDKVVKDFISLTGLPLDVVNKLYESNQIDSILENLNEDYELPETQFSEFQRRVRQDLNRKSNYKEPVNLHVNDYNTGKDPIFKSDTGVFSNIGSAIHNTIIKDDPDAVYRVNPHNPAIRANVEKILEIPNDKKTFADWSMLIASTIEDVPNSKWTEGIMKILSDVKDGVLFLKLLAYTCFLKNKDAFIEGNPAVAGEFYPEIYTDLDKLQQYQSNVRSSDRSNYGGEMYESKKQKSKDENLNENSKLYTYNTSRIDTVNDNSQPWKTPIQADIHLYTGLRDLLSRNNGVWGNNYHLDNVYNSIWQYLDGEIEELTNKNNVVEINDEFHEKFLIDLIYHQINPMYKSHDILKTLIPDIQTLVFDLIILTTEFIKQHQTELSYLDQDIWDEYFESTTNIIQSIYSSRLSSKLLDVSQAYNKKKYPNTYIDEYKTRNLRENFMFGPEFNIRLTPMYNHQLKIHNIIDCIYIVKSCQNEFNLKIRKLLNVWITKAFEITTRGEKIILSHNNISKYKN
jgi:hypothetical protein